VRVVPRKVFLQLDNTSKQNKSKYLFGWLGYLVYTGVVDRVLVSMHRVGHTHEDIDQLFSRTSVALRKMDAVCRKDLGNLLYEVVRSI
jgi:hypothetical protein